MSKRNHGLGFARIAKLVTSKNQNNLRREEAPNTPNAPPDEKEVTIPNIKEIEEKRE